MSTTRSPGSSGKETADSGVPAPSRVVPRSTLCLDIPLGGGYLAQIVIPRDLGRADMLRMRRILWTLATPGKP